MPVLGYGKKVICDYLSKYGNKKDVARHLGISRSTLYRKLKEYGIG
ncbi:MAG: helix-turn-helix domain-containing protein [Desulfotomaculales bacterium]